MRLLITALACLISVSVFGQGWEQTYVGLGEDYGMDVQQTTDGGYIITGYSIDYGNGSCYLIKTDVNGSEQWSHTFGADLSSGSYSVQQTIDGGYIITGSTYLFGPLSSSLILIKTDGNGVEEWNQTFEDSSGRSVQQTTDGGYIITGGKEGDVYLIKTDENGVEQWGQTIGGEGGEYGFSVQQTTDGGYIITGNTQQSFGNGDHDVYLIKTDGNGVEQWSQTFDNSDYENGNSIQQTNDGGYIIGAKTLTNLTYDDFHLIKTNNNGVEQWSQIFETLLYSGGGGGLDVQQTTDGGYIIVTSGNNGNGDGNNIYLIKTNENGIEQWSNTFGGTEDDNAFSVAQTSDGGYIITGSTKSFGNGDHDVYLIKTDSEGTLSSEFIIPTPSPRKLEKVVDALGREVNYTTNQILFHIYDDGSVEKKFIVE